jgi:hypothetical protein
MLFQFVIAEDHNHFFCFCQYSLFNDEFHELVAVEINLSRLRFQRVDLSEVAARLASSKTRGQPGAR